jgi:hypothetical protein
MAQQTVSGSWESASSSRRDGERVEVQGKEEMRVIAEEEEEKRKGRGWKKMG